MWVGELRRYHIWLELTQCWRRRWVVDTWSCRHALACDSTRHSLFVICPQVITATSTKQSQCIHSFKKLCGKPPQHAPSRPLQVDFRSFDPESGVRVTCDVGYLWANFGLPRPLCSRLRPDVRNRQTERRQTRIIALCLRPMGRGHNNQSTSYAHDTV